MTGPVLVLGYGVEGQATCEYLRARHPQLTLGVADRAPWEALSAEAQVRLKASGARLHFGDCYLDAVSAYRTIVKTAGIPARAPALQAAVEGGAILTSHVELFFQEVDRHSTLGVTGTKGKSTTTSLLHHLAVAGGVPALLGGNIGVPALSLLPQVNPRSRFVLELSSYQLEPLACSPHVAVLLNIVPEHLDYHGGFEAYLSAKETITRHQTKDDVLIYNADYELPSAMAARSRARLLPFSIKQPLAQGAWQQGNRLMCRLDGPEELLAEVSDIPLRGRFNVQNVLAALLGARCLGAPAEGMAAALRAFRPLPHRIEWIGEYAGIRFFNDSISTVPEATLSALEALGPDVETLLLGGHDRHLDFTAFGRALRASSVRHVILFPPTGERVWRAIQTEPCGIQAHAVTSMEEAVECAFAVTAPGRICLLSPASPSFGLFRDYQDRGSQFRVCVMARAVSPA